MPLLLDSLGDICPVFRIVNQAIVQLTLRVVETLVEKETVVALNLIHK